MNTIGIIITKLYRTVFILFHFLTNTGCIYLRYECSDDSLSEYIQSKTLTAKQKCINL